MTDTPTPDPAPDAPPPDVPPPPDAAAVEAAEDATSDLPLGGSGNEGITDGQHVNDEVAAEVDAVADLPRGATGSGEDPEPAP